MICDLAETYGIYDYRGLPPKMVATLVFGLKDDSRVKLKLSGRPIGIDRMLLTMAVDSLNYLCWSKTRDAQKGKNKPERLLDILLGNNEKPKDELVSFDTPEEYMEYIKNKRKGG